MGAHGMSIDEAIVSNRRQVLSSLGVLGALATMSSLAPAAPDRIKVLRGRVLDVTAAEPRKAGIGGVMVSNGCDVVMTKADGSYVIAARDASELFIIKPSQWTYPEARGIPKLSPTARALQFAVSHDFHLRPQPESDDFEVALIADTQAANARELSYVRAELSSAFARLKPAFAINHGDVMGDDLRLFSSYKAIVENTGLLWHHCPGNHDMDLSAASNALAFETWTREIGPQHYAFQYGRTTFILLNNVDYFGAGAVPVGGRMYRGHIGPRQLAFAANVLKNVPKDHLVVLSMHIPLRSFEDPDCAADNTDDRAALANLLAGHTHNVSFSGHSHTTEHHYLGMADGFWGAKPHHHHVLTAFCGAWWGGPLNASGVPVSDSRDGSPRGFHLLQVRGNSYETRFIAMGETPDPAMRFNLVSGEGGQSRLLVDAFDGGPRTSVRCFADGEERPIELQRTPIADPHIVESYARHRALWRPWVSPARSSHIWTAQLQANTGANLSIEIINEYGDRRHVNLSV